MSTVISSPQDDDQNNKKVDLRKLVQEQYKECARNPAYFMKKYCYIQHPVRGRFLFDLYPYQEKAAGEIKDNNRIIVLKARQLGLSTLIANYALWMATFFRDKNILVIATKQDTAKNIITKARFAYEHLPVWLQTPCIENNKLNLRFKNGSQIKAVSSSEEAARSEAVSLLIIDECAHIDEADAIWTSAQATLATGGQAILISTPNGMGNFFHLKWVESEQGQNDFYRIKLDWRVHPERDAEWEKRERAAYGPRGFRQEYEAEFLGSGNTVFDVDMLTDLKAKHCRDPIFKTGIDNNVWIFENPDYQTPYIVVADVARGDGADYSAFHIIDAKRCVQVAEYKGKIDTTMFGHMLVEFATRYNDALLVIENATMGWATIKIVMERSYKNLFYMFTDGVVDDAQKPITNKWNAFDNKKVPGWTTSARTRPLIISKLDEYVRTDAIRLYSTRIYDEMMTFIWNNGKAEAIPGYNDDLIMSLAIGLWIRDTSLQLYQNNVEMMKKALDNISRNTTHEPMYNTAHIGYDPFTMPALNNRSTNPYAVENPEDLRWLLG